MFRVGQKVVCVDDIGDRLNRWETLPVKGAIYTVREVFATSVRLYEIVNQPGFYRRDDGFDTFDELRFMATRFRPIVSRPTSIAVFEEILRKVNAPSEVSA
jgi:hypothetical protein